MKYPDFNHEEKYWADNILAVGLDEAGRGCLAGPVFAAAVVFPKNFDIELKVSSFIKEFSEGAEKAVGKSFLKKIEENQKLLINDSKKLNFSQRLFAYEFIKKHAISFAFDSINSEEIDSINILQASQKAMKKSFQKIVENNLDFHNNSFHLLIDGNYFKGYENYGFTTIVKGDAKSISIAAASIVAKVERDLFMINLSKQLNGKYRFDNHFGYATKGHFQEIDKFGISEFHRKSFLKKYELRRKEIEILSLF